MTFIEVAATAKIKAGKGRDDVAWNVINLTSRNLDVKVIDFYSATGATPFAGGAPPAQLTVPSGQTRPLPPAPPAPPLNADGDEGTYKYTVVARVAGVDPWFLVRDPEIDIEP